MSRKPVYIVRFAAVGVVNTAIDLGLYALLLPLLGIFGANLISTSAGLTFSFFANRAFTFRQTSGSSRGALLRQAGIFIGVTLVGLWLIQPAVIWLVTPLNPFDSLAFGPLVPKVAAIAVALIWNYLMYRFVVFRPRLDPEATA